MADFLLIHGSGFGAWCWRELIPALVTLGHKARAIDLPRHPGVTLEDQANAICDNLTEPTILVGHSAGGFPITAAAETDPRNICALVWLCAYIPEDDSSVASLRRRQSTQPLHPALHIDRTTASYSFAGESRIGLFFHDCPAATQAFAAASMVREPITPQETRVSLSPRSQSLPRFAITCERDRAIPPATQHEMASHLPPENRFSLNCGHAPFFTKPAETAALLDRIAARSA